MRRRLFSWLYTICKAPRPSRRAHPLLAALCTSIHVCCSVEELCLWRSPSVRHCLCSTRHRCVRERRSTLLAYKTSVTVHIRLLAWGK